jgi:hypothetical protein
MRPSPPRSVTRVPLPAAGAGVRETSAMRRLSSLSRLLRSLPTSAG